MFATWREFYQSDLQSVYALWLVPAFVIETVLDPYVTGPLLRWLSVEEPDATLCRWLFALLGGSAPICSCSTFWSHDVELASPSAARRAGRFSLRSSRSLVYLAAVRVRPLLGRDAILYEAGSFFVMRTI